VIQDVAQVHQAAARRAEAERTAADAHAWDEGHVPVERARGRPDRTRSCPRARPTRAPAGVCGPCGEAKRGASPQPTDYPSGSDVGYPGCRLEITQAVTGYAGVTRPGVASRGISAKGGRSSTVGAKLSRNPCSRNQDSSTRSRRELGFPPDPGVAHRNINPCVRGTPRRPANWRILPRARHAFPSNHPPC
jgi:hypothetical protein